MHSSGTIWVRPDTGVIVRTLLEVDIVTGRTTTPQRGHVHIDVSYKRVEPLNMWLPAAMDEEFEASRQEMRDRVTGHAEYSNYREFTTAVRIK